MYAKEGKQWERKGRKPNPGRRLSITSSETDGVLQRRKAKTQAGSLSLPTDARPVWSPAEYNANAQIRCCANNASIVRGVPMRPSHARSPSLPPPRSSRPSAGTTAAMFSLHTDPVPSSAPATSAPVYRCSHADLIAIWHQLASDRPPQRVLVLLPQRSLPRSSPRSATRSPPSQLGLLLLSPAYTHGDSRNNTGTSPSPTPTHSIPIDGNSALILHNGASGVHYVNSCDTLPPQGRAPLRVV